MKKLLLTIAGALLALPGMARDFTYEYEGQTLTYTVLDETSKTCQTKSMEDQQTPYQSHLPVIPFSTSTTFILFRFAILLLLIIIWCKDIIIP